MIPDDSDRLLLRAALDPVPEALTRFHRWRHTVELDDIGGNDFRLLPLVYDNIGKHLPDDGLKRRIRGIARHSWLRNRSRLQLCATVIDQFTQAGIPFLLIKGTAMMLRLGAVGELRVLTDCDVLVPRPHAEAAIELTRKTGLSGPPHLVLDRFAPSDLGLVHGLDFKQPGSAVGLIDLHWRVLEEVTADDLTNEFFARSAPAMLDGRSVRVPDIVDMVLHTMVHGTKWSDLSRFDWMADAVLLVRLAGQRFDGARFWSTASRYGLLGIAEEAFERLVEELPVEAQPAIWGRPQRRGSALERREARARRKDPPDRSRTDWLVLDLQRIHRSNVDFSRQTPEACLPELRRQLRAPELPIVTEVAGGTLAAERVRFLAGWSHPEQSGRWTDGPLATVAVPVPAGQTTPLLALTSVSGLPAESPPQYAGIYADNRLLARLEWPLGAGIRHRHIIDLAGVPTIECQAVLQIRIGRIRMPARTQKGGDIRRLGLFLMEAEPIAPRFLENGPINLGVGSADRNLLLHGWDETGERGGAWTTGWSAALVWNGDLPPGAYLKVRVSHAFIPANEMLSGQISINGQLAADFCFDRNDTMPCTLMVLAPSGSRTGSTELRFEFDLVQSPVAIGLSADVRLLGLLVHSIALA